MQAIYGDGVGNVDQYISDHSLELIQKPDNYRCAYEIIEAINNCSLELERNVSPALAVDNLLMRILEIKYNYKV